MRTGSNRIKCLLLSAVLLLVCGTGARAAEEPSCEVMAVSGEAASGSGPLREGDLLKKSDRITVSRRGSVDLAFDRDFRNVVNIAQDSVVALNSVSPAVVYVEEGEVTARLDALPKGSVFQLKSPTAVASVRGTVYRMENRSGVTRVFNYSGSVEVADAVKRDASPVLLVPNQKIRVNTQGVRTAPEEMTQSENNYGQSLSAEMDVRRRSIAASGRVGKLPPAKQPSEKKPDEDAETPPAGMKQAVEPPEAVATSDANEKKRVFLMPTESEPKRKASKKTNSAVVPQTSETKTTASRAVNPALEGARKEKGERGKQTEQRKEKKQKQRKEQKQEQRNEQKQEQRKEQIKEQKESKQKEKQSQTGGGDEKHKKPASKNEPPKKKVLVTSSENTGSSVQIKEEPASGKQKKGSGGHGKGGSHTPNPPAK